MYRFIVWKKALFVFLYFMFFVPLSETNLKFKMGLKVTHERLQEESQLAGFDGKHDH